MSDFLDQLMYLVLRDPNAFADLRDSHRREITPQLAAEARGRFKQAIQAQQAGEAAAAAMTASSLYLILGQRREALLNYIDYHQIRFMVASTEEAYEDIRASADHIVPMAEEIHSLDLAFQAATLMADCAYFSADLQPAPAEKERWLRQALADLVLAAKFLPQAPRETWFGRFVSLVGAFSEAFSQLVPAPDAALEGQLRQLTQAVEQQVPVDYHLPKGMDPADKTAADARRLALLSYRFGSQEIARRRLAFATGKP